VEGTLARSLFDIWNDLQPEEDKFGKGHVGEPVNPDGQTLTVKVYLFAS
jgi:hypothetical protein